MGNEGSNGGSVSLNLNKQKVEGIIYVDSISTLEKTLEDSSLLKGQINNENTAKSIKL